MSVLPLSLVAAVSLTLSSQDIAVPFEKYTLPSNGLEVILSPDHHLPVVAVNLWYHAGPVNESPGRTGFAHLFEHLMFQGSAHVGDDQHFKLLEAAGASLINGTTDYDRTNYFETVPANELALALWLESDRMGFLKPTITQEKLNNQRDVVMNERRQSVENEPYGPSQEKLIQMLFPKQHPYYGYVIGSMADLNAATLADVHAFYDHYYAPANATLVVVGDFDVAATKALIDRYFGTLPRRQAPEAVHITTPPITEERRASVEEPVSLPQVSMAWLSPKAFAPDDATCDVLAYVLGVGKSSRLYQKLVYDLQIAQNVSVQQESLELVSIFHVTVQGRPGVDLTRLEKETQAVLDGIKTAPPSDQEVARARNMLTTQMVSTLQNVGGFGGKADMLNRYNHYLHDPGYLAKDLARYDSVTPKAVQTLAASLLQNNQRVVVTTLPAPQS